MMEHEMANSILTAGRVRELLDYNQETGVFTWKTTRGGFAKAGTVAGTKDSHGHIQIKVDRKLYLAHRLVFIHVTGTAPSEVDHINRDRSDNRWANLRPVSRSQNGHNRSVGVNNTSGAVGVSFVKHLSKWQAYINVEGKRKNLGYFSDLDSAILARKKAKEELLPPGDSIQSH